MDSRQRRQSRYDRHVVWADSSKCARPQGLFYDVGQQANPSIKSSNDLANGQPAIVGLASVVTWNFDDPLGDYLNDSNQLNDNGDFQRGVILAQGRFNAGQTPAFVPGDSAANVFTQLGTQSNPPPVGSIAAATVVTQTRDNLFTFMGDADVDHTVTVDGDGQIVMANLGRSDVLWQEGDFNGDKDCDVFQADGGGDAQILTAALGLGTPPPLAAALAAPGTATATYNPATGELIVDIGSGVGVVGFETAGLFDASIYDPSMLPGFFSQVSSDVLGLFDGGAPLPTGVFSFGQVLPPGLDASQIQFGYTPLSSPSVLAPVAVVPEPAGAALAAAAILMALWMCRRG